MTNAMKGLRSLTGKKSSSFRQASQTSIQQRISLMLQFKYIIENGAVNC